MLRVSLCQRNRSRDIMTWYARIFDTETKEIRYESLGTTRKAEAQGELQARMAEGAFRKKGKSDATLGDAFDAYILYLERSGCSRSSVTTALNAFRAVGGLRKERLEGIDRRKLADAFSEAVQGKKPGSRNTMRRNIRTAIARAIDTLGLDIRNPADAIPQAKDPRPERDFWTPEQVDRILDCAPSRRYRLLWAFMAFCGLRIHEALKAVPGDIRDGNLYVMGKGAKPAKVPVCARMADEIRRAGGKWDFSGMGHSTEPVAEAARKAIPEGFRGKATNHRFRHSFASNLVRAGVNAKAVQKLMRHANIQTTLSIYSHVLDEDLAGEVEKMFGRA